MNLWGVVNRWPEEHALRPGTEGCWALAILVAAVGACSVGNPDGHSNVTVDTLDGGRVVVSNPDLAAAAEPRILRLVVETEMGNVEAGPSPVFFERPASLAADPLGRVYVADAQAARIRVFGNDGSLLRSIGQLGGGPGEFQTWLAGIVWQEPNRLWVADASRFMAFDSLGVFVNGSLRRRGGSTISSSWSGWVDTTGFLYSRESELGIGVGSGDPRRSERLTRFRVSGGDTLVAADTFPLAATQPDHRIADRGGGILELVDLPMAARTVWAVSPAGTVWLAHTSTYRLDELTFAGDTLHTIELRRSPEPLVGAERDSVADGSSVFSASDLPATKPVMSALYVARDGWIWVRVRPAPTSEWDIFDDCGRFLGPAVSMVPLSAVTFPGRGMVIGVTTDELDVPRIVRLKLQTGQGEAVTAKGCGT